MPAGTLKVYAKSSATRRQITNVLRKGHKLRKRRLRNPMKASLGLDIVPRKQFATFTYETNLVGNKVGGNTCGYGLVRLNSIADPEYTSLGKNKPCQGVSQCALIYQKYKVYKCNVSFELVNGASKACILGFAPQNDLTSTGVTNKVTDIGTRKDGKTVMLGYLTENKKVNFSYDIKKLEGINEGAFDDEQYAAFLTTNPTQQLYLVYAIGQIGEGTDENIAVYFKIRVTYYAKLFDRIEVTDQA